MLGVCYYPEQVSNTRWAGDLARIRALGIGCLRVAEFAWSRLEPAAGQFQPEWLDRFLDLALEHELQVVLCTPTAAAPRWLVDRYPEILPVDSQGRVRRSGSRRHSCFSSPAWRQESERIVTAMADRFGQHPALTGWQLDNEYGCHDTVRCYCPRCHSAFRSWLKERYPTLEKLNLEWGTVFWSQSYGSFEEIDLPMLAVADPHPSLVLDYYRFASHQVSDYNRRQARILSDTRGWKTHNFMGNFSQLDAFSLCDDLDLAAWDNYPLEFARGWPGTGHPDGAAFHHDLYRRCGRGRFLVMEQQCGAMSWGRHNPSPLPGMVRLWTWEALAHGAEAVFYFRWGEAPWGQEQLLEGLRPEDLPTDLFPLPPVERAPVALVYDYEAAWASEILPHGQDWNYAELVFLFYEALRSLGLDVDIARPGDDLSAYALSVAPSLPTRSLTVDVSGPRTGMHTPTLGRADARRVESFSERRIHEWRGKPYPLERWREDSHVEIPFWPSLEFLRDFFESRGLPTQRLPEGVRLRRRGHLTFCFNYSDSPQQVGVHRIPPRDLAYWQTQI